MYTKEILLLNARILAEACDFAEQLNGVHNRAGVAIIASALERVNVNMRAAYDPTYAQECYTINVVQGVGFSQLEDLIKDMRDRQIDVFVQYANTWDGNRAIYVYKDLDGVERHDDINKHDIFQGWDYTWRDEIMDLAKEDF